MDFSSRYAWLRRNLAALAAVALFHVLLVWLLVSGLGRKAVEVVHAPIEARIVAEARPLPPPPERLMPPPPKFQAPPPPYIPPPEVRIAAPPPAPTITVQKETPPPPQADIRPLPPPAPAPPAPAPAPPPPAPAPAPALPAPVAAAVGVVCPGHSETLRSAGFPREAERGGVEKGEVTVQFTVTASGQVRDAEVVKSTSRLLNRSSVESVRRFECRSPGRETRVTIDIVYQLD